MSRSHEPRSCAPEFATLVDAKIEVFRDTETKKMANADAAVGVTADPEIHINRHDIEATINWRSFRDAGLLTNARSGHSVKHENHAKPE